MGAGASEPDERRKQYEGKFRRAGLPLLIEGREAKAYTGAHGLRLLVTVFVVALGIDASLGLSAMENVFALGAASGIVIFGVAVWRYVKGRPLLAMPESVGWWELALFALIPSIPPLLLGEVVVALATVAVNLTLVGAVFGALRLGLFHIVAWAAGHLVGQLGRSLGLLTRAIPMLLLFSVVLFVNTEMWQVFARMPNASLIAVVGLLVLSGAGFAGARIGSEIDDLLEGIGADAQDLKRSQRANVGLVLFAGQMLQVLVVSLSVAGFFVLFGLFAISGDVIAEWIGSEGDELRSFDFFGLVELHLTVELLRVSAAIAAFSGLFFLIAVSTDAAYRKEFIHEVTEEMSETFAEWREYLKIL